MLTSTAGDPAYDYGQIVELPLPIADAWIAAGYCEAMPRVEAAMQAPTERAMQPGGKARR